MFDAINRIMEQTKKNQQLMHDDIRDKVLALYEPVITACSNMVYNRNQRIQTVLANQIMHDLQAVKGRDEYDFGHYATALNGKPDPDGKWMPTIEVSDVSVEATDPYGDGNYSTSRFACHVVIDLPSVIALVRGDYIKPIVLTPQILREVLPDLIPSAQCITDWFKQDETNVTLILHVRNEVWEHFADDEYTREPPHLARR